MSEYKERIDWCDAEHAVEDDAALIEFNNFPNHIMRGYDRDFVEIYSDRLESPPQFFWACYMTLLGSVVAPKVKLDLALHTPIKLYTLLIGQSAVSRKSTAMWQTRALYEVALNRGVTCVSGISSGVGLKEVLLDSPAVLFYCDEFKQFIKVCGYSNSDLLDLVTQLHSDTTAESHKSGVHNKVDEAYLSVLGACTLAAYSDIYAGSALDLGFTNRIFIVPGSRVKRKPLPRPFEQEELIPMSAAIQAMVMWCERHPVITISMNAKRIYSEWYMEYTVSDYSRRIEDYAMRFMALLAVARGEPQITDTVVRDTIDLMTWQIAMRQQYDPIDADGFMAKMESKIVRILRSGDEVPHWQLYNRTNARRAGQDVFDKAIDTLVKHDWVLVKKTGEKYSNRRYKLIYDPELHG